MKIYRSDDQFSQYRRFMAYSKLVKPLLDEANQNDIGLEERLEKFKQIYEINIHYKDLINHYPSLQQAICQKIDEFDHEIAEKFPQYYTKVDFNKYRLVLSTPRNVG